MRSSRTLSSFQYQEARCQFCGKRFFDHYGDLGAVIKWCSRCKKVDAIRMVARGRFWLTDKVAAQAIRQLAGQEPKESRSPGDALESLTPREQEILALIGIGASNAQIAGRLSVSKRTVENHVSSIYAKLRLSDRIQLAMYAISHGLVDRLLSDRSGVGG